MPSFVAVAGRRRRRRIVTSAAFLAISAVIFNNNTVPTFAAASTNPKSKEGGVKVNVYHGPKDCNVKASDGSITKISVGDTVALHFTVDASQSWAGHTQYTVTIDPSSQAGTIGQKVQSSHDRGIAPSFPVGQGKVIKGLDDGLVGLCKGSKAYIVIPPHLAYGNHGVPESNVPGGTTLRYDVEIIDIKPPTPNDFVKIDTNGDGKLSKDEARTYFDQMGQAINLDALWKEEDMDVDGSVSWDEFSGPKGDAPPPSSKHYKEYQDQLQQQKQDAQRQQQQQQQQQQQARAKKLLLLPILGRKLPQHLT